MPPIRPPHHQANGDFCNPWPGGEGAERGAFLRWRRERLSKELAPNPRPEEVPLATPEVAYPLAHPDEFLVQIRQGE